MKNKVFRLTRKDLVSYLEDCGDKRGINSKDFDYYAAISASKLLGDELKLELDIAFPLTNKIFSEEYTVETIGDLKKLLDEYKNEDSDIDFILAPKSKPISIGWPFQVKRGYLKDIMGDAKESTEEKIAKYVNFHSNKYIDINLSIWFSFLEGDMKNSEIGFNPDKVSTLLKIQTNIHRIFLHGSQGDQEFFTIIWPRN